MSAKTLDASLSCVPSSGTLPFETTMTVVLTNNYTAGCGRCFAGRIDVVTASGMAIPNWRSGWVIVDPGASAATSFTKTLPAYPTLIGTNTLTLVAEDVTPPPYNQPPYQPSGDTDTDSCTQEGVAPLFSNGEDPSARPQLKGDEEALAIR